MQTPYSDQYLFDFVTDRIRRMRESNVFSLFTPVGGGGYPGQVQMGGYPSQVQRGVPHLGYPRSHLARGTSHQTWLGWYPRQGVPCQGVPHLGYPQSDLAGGVPPIRPGQGSTPGRGYPARGYHTLDTPCQTWPGGTPMEGTPPQVLPHWAWPGGTPGGGTPPQLPPLSGLAGGLPHLR